MNTHPSTTHPSTTTLNRPGMSVTVSRPRRSIVLCSVAGEVDMMTVPLLREQLSWAIDAECRGVVADLTAVTFFSAGGLRVLDDVQRSDGGRDLVLVGAGAHLCKMLDLCQVGYPRYGAIDEALCVSV